MFESIKNLFKKKSHVNSDGVRYNTNLCEYCKEEIGPNRFRYNKGKHYHKACLKKMLKEQKDINNE